jgi:hypothetical protein
VYTYQALFTYSTHVSLLSILEVTASVRLFSPLASLENNSATPKLSLSWPVLDVLLAMGRDVTAAPWVEDLKTRNSPWERKESTLWNKTITGQLILDIGLKQIGFDLDEKTKIKIS